MFEFIELPNHFQENQVGLSSTERTDGFHGALKVMITNNNYSVQIEREKMSSERKHIADL
jgi:hypothetical protein